MGRESSLPVQLTRTCRVCEHAEEFDAFKDGALEKSDQWMIEHYQGHTQEDYVKYFVLHWVGLPDWTPEAIEKIETATLGS